MAMKIFVVELIDESCYHVFVESTRDALNYVVSRYYPHYSIEEFNRKYSPIVEQVDHDRLFEVKSNESTVLEWLANNCISNTY